MSAPVPVPRVLTIAGSDSGGGAGIQADLKTFTALGVYGMSAITALTAQNTVGVTGIHDVPAEFVAEQIDVVYRDIGVDAVKTGMLSNAEIIEAVADRLALYPIRHIVIDPVMVATSGDPLLRDSARDALRSGLLPLATIVTPNIPETEILSGMAIHGIDDLRRAARALYELGPQYVLIKGGHLEGPEAIDYLFDGSRFQTFTMPRIQTTSTHGTGCTYASAIAAYLARGFEIAEAVRLAKRYLTRAIQRAKPIGHGHGPVHHGWPLDETAADG